MYWSTFFFLLNTAIPSHPGQSKRHSGFRLTMRVNTGTLNPCSSYLHCTWINLRLHMMWVWTSAITKCHLGAMNAAATTSMYMKRAWCQVDSHRSPCQQLCPLRGKGDNLTEARFSAAFNWTLRKCAAREQRRQWGDNWQHTQRTHTCKCGRKRGI